MWIGERNALKQLANNRGPLGRGESAKTGDQDWGGGGEGKFFIKGAGKCTKSKRTIRRRPHQILEGKKGLQARSTSIPGREEGGGRAATIASRQSGRSSEVREIWREGLPSAEFQEEGKKDPARHVRKREKGQRR